MTTPTEAFVTPGSIRLVATLQRKDARLPVFIVVPGHFVQPLTLTGTTVVEGVVDGHPIGRRTLKPWGKGSEDWFLELTSDFCASARLVTGQAVSVALILADTSLPTELAAELARNSDHHSAWQQLSARLQR
jgi:hypothetical protein